MSQIKLPFFGNVDSESLDDYYETSCDFAGKEIQVDLTFINKSIDQKRLDITKQFIENLRIHDLNNKKHIQSDFDNNEDGIVQSYLINHIEDLATDDLNRLTANAKTADQPKALLKKVHLIRVGIFPDSKGHFSIFDYSLGTTLTDYLIVVNTDENGNKLGSIRMEF
ncbi:MAG: DUF2004 domain-containing protein [Pelobium sp.]